MGAEYGLADNLSDDQQRTLEEEHPSLPRSTLWFSFDDVRNLVNKVADKRNSFLLLVVLAYGAGYGMWALHAHQNNLGFISASNAQYLTAGAVPLGVFTLVAWIFPMATSWTEREKVYSYYAGTDQAIEAIRDRFWFKLIFSQPTEVTEWPNGYADALMRATPSDLDGDENRKAFALRTRGPARKAYVPFLWYSFYRAMLFQPNTLLFSIVAAFLHTEHMRIWVRVPSLTRIIGLLLSSIYFLQFGVTTLAFKTAPIWLLVLLLPYYVYVFPMLPQELGGVKPKCATLWMESPPSELDDFFDVELEILRESSAILWIRNKDGGNVTQLDRQMVTAIYSCGD